MLRVYSSVTGDGPVLHIWVGVGSREPLVSWSQWLVPGRTRRGQHWIQPWTQTHAVTNNMLIIGVKSILNFWCGYFFGGPNCGIKTLVEWDQTLNFICKYYDEAVDNWAHLRIKTSSPFQFHLTQIQVEIILHNVFIQFTRPNAQIAHFPPLLYVSGSI